MRRLPRSLPGRNGPAADYAGQDASFARAFAVLRDAILQGAFPAACAGVLKGGKLLVLRALGRFTYDAASPEVVPETIFDLASTTKVVATTTMAMILYERGLLDLDVPVAGILPEFGRGDARRREITMRMLLAHSSGLPAYERLFDHAHTPEELLHAAMIVPLMADPGTRAAYSDIGFIVLGSALERLADEPLDAFCRREIFGPLGMAHTMFNPAAELRPQIPPTEDDRAFRRRVVQGEVHDENAWVMGGVAGHAGLFATAYDVTLFAHAMLNGGAPLVRPETLRLFVRRDDGTPNSSRALGWDTPSAPSQSGKYLSSGSFGHLGFTGSSLWIDPEHKLAIVLLTNRTWPDRRSQKIKVVRPQFHDAIVECLGESV